MFEPLAPYARSVVALGLFGLLHLLQMLVADLIAIRRRHPPGVQVPGGHEDLLFRTTRAHANTTESIGATALIAAFAILSGAEPAWVNVSLEAFLVLRIAHCLAYYANWPLGRGVAFTLAFGALMIVSLVGGYALCLGDTPPAV